MSVHITCEFPIWTHQKKFCLFKEAHAGFHDRLGMQPTWEVLSATPGTPTLRRGPNWHDALRDLPKPALKQLEFGGLRKLGTDI